MLMKNTKEISDELNTINKGGRPYVPVWEKYALTITEAAEYFGIGENRLREIVHENRRANYVMWIGTKVEIKRKLFEIHLNTVNSL